jgi:hypothetical protein
VNASRGKGASLNINAIWFGKRHQSLLSVAGKVKNVSGNMSQLKSTKSVGVAREEMM